MKRASVCHGGFGAELEPELTFSLSVRLGESTTGLDDLVVETSLLLHREFNHSTLVILTSTCLTMRSQLNACVPVVPVWNLNQDSNQTG
jgi:hypothetical protein